MGGRGGSSGLTLSASQERKLEDAAQRSDAKFEGWRVGAKNYEYTDITGKKHTGKTGRNTGGTYRTQYNEQIANYAKMSTSALKKELEKQKSNSQNAGWGINMRAASRVGSHVKDLVDADTKIKMINQVLRRRKKKK